MPRDLPPVIDELRQARRDQRIPIKELARRMSIAPRTIARWHNGARYPSFGKLLEWATALNLKITTRKGEK